MTSALISADELHGIVGQAHVRLLDASYGQPPFDRGIEGAIDFDIDTVADPQAPLAHTLPSPDIFAAHVGGAGIGNDDLVIVYDRSGIAMAAARVWWMFRVFGHDNVRILDGGLPAWAAAGYPVVLKKSSVSPAFFKAYFRPELFARQQDILNNLTTPVFTVIDARDPRRYAGEVPEPRAGIEPGHIPQSLNLPFMSLINPQTGRMLDKAALAEKIMAAGINLSNKTACSCGSGVTACVIALALYEIGHTDAAIYGGSWTEWGGDPAMPKKKGVTP